MTTKSQTKSEAAEFLERLRPGGPWMLITIKETDDPEPPIRAENFTDTDAAQEFITRSNVNGTNVYYSVNPTKHAMSRKAKKEHIAAAEWLHVDADPKDDETSEQFKTRMMPVIKEFKPTPTLVINSGNGFHLLWKLKTPFKIKSSDDIATIKSYNRALAIALKAPPSSGNIDRVLRAPGTINFPNTVKQRKGRKKCKTSWLYENNFAYSLEDFPPPVAEQDDPPPHDVSGSGYGFRFFQDCKKRGLDFDAACEAILADGGAAGEWANRVDERQLNRAWDRAQAPRQSKKEYVLVNASDVIPRPLQWLWRGHLLKGAQEILNGFKGMGKSRIHCALAACATTGQAWPNGERGCPPGNVIMVTAEDVLDAVMVPRLILAGADLTKIKFLDAIRQDFKDRMFLLGEDLDQLEKMIRDVGNVCLVTIDPITAFMGKINSSSPTDVRGQLGPLAKLAERTQVAFSTITHPPKQTTARAFDSFIGSQAFIAAARIGHLCVQKVF